MESMEEDMKYIEAVLGFSQVWDDLQEELKDWMVTERNHIKTAKIIFNKTSNSRTYAHFMSSLKSWEFKVLYRIFAKDFSLLGYNPCDQL